MKFLLCFIVCFFLSGSSACGQRSSPGQSKLATAQIEVESGGDGYDKAIGDKKLANPAYGCLQIREPCIKDVNEAFGTNYRAKDCLNNRKLSLWVHARYMELWATKKQIGREPTDEDRARIWRGGPDGWKKASTLEYWEKVKKALAAL